MTNTIQSKRCSRCKQTFPQTTKYFYKDNFTIDGLYFNCKHCRRQISKQYYQSHPRKKQQKQMKQYNRQYYATLRGYLRHVWNHMNTRCNNPKHPQYKDWGGRGIQVKFACFEDFFNYVKELKAEPRGLTIDRINNDGHYQRGNIRFVSRTENCRNRRKAGRKHRPAFLR